MIVRLPREFLFPLAITAFTAVPISYVNILFTPTTRWGFLALLIVYLLIKGRLALAFQSPFALALVAYCTWCLLTGVWSEVPKLSVAKAVSLVLVSVAFISGGQGWVYDRGPLNALNCLVPITILGLFAGISGGASSEVAAQGFDLYQGLTSNPNMLGSLVAMALPLLAWNTYRYRTAPKAKWIWLALLVLATALLLRTHARSSLLAAAAIGLGFLMSIKLSRTAFVLALVGGALFVATVASTNVIDSIYNEYILKGSSDEQILAYSHGEEEGGLLYSRRHIWEQSYANAVQGGMFGAGYGVTVGEMDFEVGLTAVGYGREKGNTQLAIVEETGLVGLGLYFLLLCALFFPLVRAHWKSAKGGDMKVLLGVVAGALAGFTLMSVFEAWWVAPGSPESGYFWGLAGVAVGLTYNPALAAAHSARRRLMPQAIVPAPRLPPQGSVKGG